MSKPALFAALFLYLVSAHLLAATLTTETYRGVVKDNCEEGSVTCNDVQISIFVNANNTLKTTGTGKTIHTLCADRVTPCRFQGYELVDGAATIRLLERGTFEVILDQDKLVHSEEGKWEN